ncbi:heavy-metal-associated domain-containing protein [Stutzerimonas chloritidismutans]|uniref:heavy-metal-associated domain-containing protein n=1 Tax=Stutzerimonas chloritidismutans TaxID=203192 RepID=UPI003F1745EF
MNTTTVLQVQGMTCGSCVRHVTQALTPLAGVESVSVDLEGAQVKVDGNPDVALLLETLTEAGYPAQLASGATFGAPRKGGCGGGCGCR